MPSGEKFEYDSIVLDTFKKNLHALDNLPLMPHDEGHVLRIKQHLRTRIRELEQRLGSRFHLDAV